MTVAIAVGIQDEPPGAPSGVAWVSDYALFAQPTFAEAMAAVSALAFAFSGIPAYFAIVSEMREPKNYNRSLFLCQGVVTVTYLAISVVVYYYCGSYVASPALGSAGPLLKKICYGLALPGLIATTTINIHVCISLYHVY